MISSGQHVVEQEALALCVGHVEHSVPWTQMSCLVPEQYVSIHHPDSLIQIHPIFGQSNVEGINLDHAVLPGSVSCENTFDINNENVAGAVQSPCVFRVHWYSLFPT